MVTKSIYDMTHEEIEANATPVRIISGLILGGIAGAAIGYGLGYAGAELAELYTGQEMDSNVSGLITGGVLSVVGVVSGGLSGLIIGTNAERRAAEYDAQWA